MNGNACAKIKRAEKWVDRLDARAINRQQLSPEQINPPAQDHELAENLFERGAIVAPAPRIRANSLLLPRS
jgi:hypothetical protein